MEWVRRYLPNEIVGTCCELGGAAAAYVATDSLAVAVQRDRRDADRGRRSRESTARPPFG